MNKAVLISVYVLVLSVGCASNAQLSPPQPHSDARPAMKEGTNTQPDLRPVPTTTIEGRLNFGYNSYGDSGAVPNLVYDDGHHIYLLFKPGEALPVPMTRDGKLLEYEVMQGGVIKIPKVDTFKLQSGLRVAFVDSADIEVLSLAKSLGTPRGVSALKSTAAPGQDSLLHVEPPATTAPSIAPSAPAPPSPPVERASVAIERYTFDLFDKESARRLLAETRLTPGAWRLCHAPTVRDFTAARAVRSMLETKYKDVCVMLTDTCTKPGEAVLERF